MYKDEFSYIRDGTRKRGWVCVQKIFPSDTPKVTYGKGEEASTSLSTVKQIAIKSFNS